jgi:uncharacterized protein (DUF1015 family)
MTAPKPTSTRVDGLSLAPMRGLRPNVDDTRLAKLLCPPYDVIDAEDRARLLEADPDNAVAVILPDPTPAGYAQAAQQLTDWLQDGTYAVDDDAALYVYEMRDKFGNTTRGLLGAVQLRDPADGVILPHENTMAGPVADRLAVMTETGADLEPIYLVYDGGGAASQLVRDADSAEPVAQTTTPDGVTHRLWAIADAQVHAAIAADLAPRRALIADGHHRYATYRERQRLLRDEHGPGPWDRGLALVVDTSDYGPQVHAIHRVIPGIELSDAVGRLTGHAAIEETPDSPQDALASITDAPGFAAVLSDSGRTFVITDPDGTLAGLASRPDDVPALTDLDVTVVHRGLVEGVWELADDVDTVRYAHDVDEALSEARTRSGFAILLRPTPVSAVAAVAAAGARMPRKSTLFTPKPASGLLMRRLSDQSELPA